MLDIQVNEETVKSMLQKSIDKRVEELAKQKYFLTYNELADYVNLSKPTIDERLLKNGMKYYKQGSKYLFKKSDVDSFLDDMTNQMNITNNDIKFFAGLKGGVNA